jgi:hypothetical protein
VLVGGHELAGVDGCVQRDDVLEVEQVGVLSGGHDRSGRVGQLTRSPVAVREYGEDAASLQSVGREQCDKVSGGVGTVSGTGAVAVVAGQRWGQAGDDQVRAIGAVRRVV